MDFYCHPGKYGMKTIGEIDWSSGEYEFALTVVWAKEDGTFWYGEDEGCSCPSPFEDQQLSDLKEITSLREFMGHCASRTAQTDNALQIVNLLERLHAAGLR